MTNHEILIAGAEKIFRPGSHFYPKILLLLAGGALAVSACGPQQDPILPGETPSPTPTSDHMDPATPTENASPVPLPTSTEALSLLCFPGSIIVDEKPHRVDWFPPGSIEDFTHETFKFNPEHRAEIAVIQYGDTMLQILLGKNGIDVSITGDAISAVLVRAEDGYTQVLVVDGIPSVAFAGCNGDGDRWVDPWEIMIGGVDGSLGPLNPTPEAEVQGSWTSIRTPIW